MLNGHNKKMIYNSDLIETQFSASSGFTFERSRTFGYCTFHTSGFLKVIVPLYQQELLKIKTEVFKFMETITK